MRQNPHEINTAGTTEGNTLAVDDTGTLRYVDGSVPVVILEPGQTSADVPAGTPVGSFIPVKA